MGGWLYPYRWSPGIWESSLERQATPDWTLPNFLATLNLLAFLTHTALEWLDEAYRDVRIYYTIRNQRVVLLLAGGNKSSQDRDIHKAKTILSTLED